MDSTFNAWSPEVIQIRKNTYNPTKVAPVLRLVAINTIEHALLCVSSEANGLYACVEAVMILRNEAGVVDPAYEAALGSAPKETARWIKNRCKGKYNIPAFPELPLFETVAASQASGTDDAHIDKRKRQVSGARQRSWEPRLMS